MPTLTVVSSPLRLTNETLQVSGSIGSMASLLSRARLSVMPISWAAWRIRCSVSVIASEPERMADRDSQRDERHRVNDAEPWLVDELDHAGASGNTVGFTISGPCAYVCVSPDGKVIS